MFRRLASAAALVATAALVLVGCTPPEPTETSPAPRPAPSASPVSSSSPSPYDTARVREAWELYQSRMSELGADPRDASRSAVLEVATPEFGDFLLDNLSDAANRRVHTEGTRRTITFVITDDAGTETSISAHVCVDVSEERVVGDEGGEIARPESPQSQTVEFAATEQPQRYLVAGVTRFNGSTAEDPCA